MILVAGLTPAWQQILRFERLQLGEVNRAAEHASCASGKVLNVGLALARLGASVQVVSPGGGPLWNAMDEELRGLGCDVAWIRTAAPTRVCTTILDMSTEITTELVENASPLAKAELDLATQTVIELARQAQLLILTGSLPRGTPSTWYRDLLRATRVPAVLDVRGSELLSTLDERPLVVKPNREELGQTVGRELVEPRDVWRGMDELRERGARQIVVSQGNGELFVLDEQGASYCVPVLTAARVVNPIGCGDCLAAGIAWGLSLGKPLAEAVGYGVAAAAQNVEQLLPARLDPQRTRAWAASIEPRRVAR